MVCSFTEADEEEADDDDNDDEVGEFCFSQPLVGALFCLLNELRANTGEPSEAVIVVLTVVTFAELDGLTEQTGSDECSLCAILLSEREEGGLVDDEDVDELDVEITLSFSCRSNSMQMSSISCKRSFSISATSSSSSRSRLACT